MINVPAYGGYFFFFHALYTIEDMNTRVPKMATVIKYRAFLAMNRVTVPIAPPTLSPTSLICSSFFPALVIWPLFQSWCGNILKDYLEFKAIFVVSKPTTVHGALGTQFGQGSFRGAFFQDLGQTGVLVRPSQEEWQVCAVEGFPFLDPFKAEGVY